MCTSQLHSFISCCITYLLALVSTHLNAYVHTHTHTHTHTHIYLQKLILAILPTLLRGALIFFKHKARRSLDGFTWTIAK